MWVELEANDFQLPGNIHNTLWLVRSATLRARMGAVTLHRVLVAIMYSMLN